MAVVVVPLAIGRALLLLTLSSHVTAFPSSTLSSVVALGSQKRVSDATGGGSVRWPTTSSLSSSSSTDSNNVVTSTQQIELESGVSMLVLSSVPPQKSNKPTLVFAHGSFHGAWCWVEHYFPYFVAKGYPVVALSWRGTHGTFAGEGVRKVKIMQHVADLQAFLDELDEGTILGNGLGATSKPVLIAHSFGSLAIMKYLETHPVKNQLAGLAILCGVPPSGNGRLTMRTLRRSLVDSWKITAGFAMKRCTKKPDLCRDLFFGGPVVTDDNGTVVNDHGISDEDVVRYQSYFALDSTATIDLLDLAKILPSAQAVDGVAPFVDDLPSCLVVGGTRDFIVDEMGNEETAQYFGCDKPVMVDAPHDVMLGSDWQRTADVLAEWLQGLEQ